MYVCMYVCMCVCTFTMMFIHTHTHTHTHACAHMCARAPTCMHAYLELCDGLVDWDVLACAYIHIHAYKCIYTHIYRTMWWPSWWGRTHVWEQTALCCCWIPWSLRVLHRSSLLTSGELSYMCVYMYVYMYVCMYVCTCMLLLGPLVAASIAHCTHAHATSSRVCMCLCVCN
jgi:hypothetical protein